MEASFDDRLAELTARLPFVSPQASLPATPAIRSPSGLGGPLPGGASAAAALAQRSDDPAPPRWTATGLDERQPSSSDAPERNGRRGWKPWGLGVVFFY